MQDRGLIRIDEYFEDHFSKEEILEFTNSVQNIDGIDIIKSILSLLIVFGIIRYFFLKYCDKNRYRYEATKRWDEILTQNNHTLKARNLLELMRDIAEDSFDKSSLPTTYDSSWWNFVKNNSDVKIDITVVAISTKISAQPYEEITGSEMMLVANSVKDWIQTYRPKC